MNTINIQGDFYRQEKIRAKKESVIIIPKKKKEKKNAQIKLSFSYFVFSKELLLFTAELFLEQWSNYFDDYSIFRVFYDVLPENSSRLLISFNTPKTLSHEEGENILRVALQIMEEILNSPIDSNKNNVIIQNINSELDKQEILLNKLINNNQSLPLQNSNSQDSELEEQIILLNKKLSDKDSETTLIKNERDNLTYKLSQKTETLQTLKKQLINQKSMNNKLDERLNETHGKLLKEIDLNKTISKSIRNLQNILDDTNNELLKQINLKDEAIVLSNNLQSQINEVSQELQKQINLKDEAIVLSNNLQPRIDEVSQELQKQINLKDEAIVLSNNLQSQIEEVSQELQKQIALKDDIITTSSNLQQSLNTLHQDLQKEKETNRNKDSFINKLQNSLNEANIKLQEQTKTADETVKLSDSLQLKLDEVSQELQKQVTLKENTLATSSNLQDTLDKLEKELQLEKELNKKNNYIIDDLQKALSKSNKNSLEETIEIPNDSSKFNKKTFKTPVSEKKLITTLNEISTNWEHIYKDSQSNYQQTQLQATDKKKINYSDSKQSSNQIQASSLTNINKKNLSEQDSLTNDETAILDLFNHYDSSKSNKTISIGLEEYNYYMDTLLFLPSTWQTYFMNGSIPDDNIFYRTFNPFIDELMALLEEISLNAHPKLLNKNKVAITIDDLKLLEAYNSLLSYISSKV